MSAGAVMNNERWRKVPGFPRHDASDRGQIGSRCNNNGKLSKTRQVLKPKIDKNRYACVVLYRDGRGHHKLVHRLVLEAFKGPCPPGHEASHDDGDSLNNIPSNLLWEIPGENSRRLKRCKRISEALRGHKVSDETRRRMGKAARKRKRRPQTAETCRKISEAQRGRRFSPEHCEAIRRGKAEAKRRRQENLNEKET